MLSALTVQRVRVRACNASSLDPARDLAVTKQPLIETKHAYELDEGLKGEELRTDD